MNYAYIRVSCDYQNELRQRKCLERYKIDKWFSEKVSGKDMDRAELQKMLKEAKSGDTIYISDFSRLAQNTYDLLLMAEEFRRRKINLISAKEQFDISTTTGKFLLTIISALNEYEREITLERQKEGIAIAKAQGKFKGGKPKEVDLDLFHENFSAYLSEDITKTEFAEKLGVSRPTLNKLIKKYLEE